MDKHRRSRIAVTLRSRPRDRRSARAPMGSGRGTSAPDVPGREFRDWSWRWFRRAVVAPRSCSPSSNIAAASRVEKNVPVEPSCDTGRPAASHVTPAKSSITILARRVSPVTRACIRIASIISPMTVGEAVLRAMASYAPSPARTQSFAYIWSEDLRHDRVAAGLARDLFSRCALAQVEVDPGSDAGVSRPKAGRSRAPARSTARRRPAVPLRRTATHRAG